MCTHSRYRLEISANEMLQWKGTFVCYWGLQYPTICSMMAIKKVQGHNFQGSVLKKVLWHSTNWPRNPSCTWLCVCVYVCMDVYVCVDVYHKVKGGRNREEVGEQVWPYQQVSGNENSRRARPKLPHDDVTVFLVHVAMLHKRAERTNCNPQTPF